MFFNARLKHIWAFCFALFSCVYSNQHHRVCHFHNWAHQRAGAASYTVANVDPSLCTHLMYAYVGFHSRGQLVPAFGEGEYSTYTQFNRLKDRNPGLKTLISVGGWNFGSRLFSVLTADPTSRNRFVTNVVIFLRQYGFDGVDLSWEYPGSRGGSAAKDKGNFVLLCKELKEAFLSESTGNSHLILSASAPASTALMDVGYDIRELDRYVDVWNLMTYDYHGAWEGKTGHSSPLYAASNLTWPQDTNTLEWTAEEYVNRGASRQKVMVGLSTSGTSFRLTSPLRHSPGSPASLGPPGPVAKEPGVWAFYEVCQKISEGSGDVKRDVNQRVPYYVSGDLWISYDDEESIKEKVDWLKRNGYGGFVMRSLDMDVFTPSLCPSALSPYPLLSAATSALLLPSSSSQVGPGTGVQIDSQAGAHTRLGSQTGSGSLMGSQTGSGSLMGSQTGSGSLMGSQTGSGSLMGSQTGSGSRTGSQTGSGSQSGYQTGSGSQTGYQTESQTGSGSQTESQTGSGSQTGSQTGSGSQMVSQTGSSSQTGSQSGSGTQTGTGSTTGSGSQTDAILPGFLCKGRAFKTYSDPSSPCRYIVCWADMPHYKTCLSGQVFSQVVGACHTPLLPLPC